MHSIVMGIMQKQLPKIFPAVLAACAGTAACSGASNPFNAPLTKNESTSSGRLTGIPSNIAASALLWADQSYALVTGKSRVRVMHVVMLLSNRSGGGVRFDLGSARLLVQTQAGSAFVEEQLPGAPRTVELPAGGYQLVSLFFRLPGVFQDETVRVVSVASPVMLRDPA